MQAFPESEPEIKVDPQDAWILIYTSGTTGKPKGVVRSHESHIAFYLINAVDFGFNEHDICLNVMPLCHINSTFFTFTFTYIGGTAYIHPARSFQAEEILEIIERENITVDIKENVLTLKGERKIEEEAKEENYYRKERCAGTFERAFTLPNSIDPEKIKANFKDGVLKVEIPKPEEKKPKQIKINVG